jgi:recombination protein RecT
MSKALQKNPVDVLKNIVNSESVQQRLKDALDDQAGLFAMSVIDVYSSSTDLMKCDAGAVMAEAMKAAALKLPMTKSLGFAYILPFGTTPTFCIGYKGMIQLAMRTGQFKTLNADCVYQGETVKTNRLTGAVEITGEPKPDKKGNLKAIGYFAHMELINGFKKTIYWDHAKVMAHAEKYSKSFKFKSSTWVTNPESMCIKTVVRQLLGKWAPMSVDFINSDGEEEKSEEKDITPDEPEKPKAKKQLKPEPKKDDKGNEVIDGDFQDMGNEPGQGDDPY